MKKSLIALAMLVAIPAVPVALAGFGPGQSLRGGPNVEYMAVALDLTPEQQEKMKALFAEKARQREEMRATMRADMQTRLQGILSKEQYDKMLQLRQARMGDKGAGMGPGGGRGLGSAMAGGCPRGMR